MEFIYTFMLAVMVVLAITGLFIGVMNDAANFLNSAIASKAASLKIIMAVASIGIIVGAATSSGMMEVARSGMFHPSMFSFREVMILYLSVMLANIILLDIYNTMGLPTSTTVALVFCLLGSAVAVSWLNPANEMADCIKSGGALTIVAGILLSVVLAFTCGTFVMYLSRLLFSFRYKPMFRRFGALWCGISFTAIVYFALFKGLKGMLHDNPVIQFIDENLLLSLAAIWVVCSILLYFAQMFKVNILKVNILAGTFALALAFAGNDLVNFIGVPVAGYESYCEASANGGMLDNMSFLENQASADPLLLLGAGLIMIVTLWTSKRALSVSKTELSLSSQDEGGEQYGATNASRGLVRMAMAINSAYEQIMPQRIQHAIAKRFEPLTDEEREGGSYDLIRATVNLTTASILISIATSLKLPLSTTYVCFMVSMGSSLADRAWGRESAVYRITGVMTVITGWFVTALAGFVISLVVTMILIYGGAAAIIVAVAVCALMIVRSNFSKREESAEVAPESKMTPEIVRSPECALIGFTEHVLTTMETVTRIYDRTIVAVFKENRKVLKDMVRESETLYHTTRKQKYELMPILNTIKENDINTGHYYVQVVDYISEASKALLHITRPCYEHIDNNHEGFSKEQIVDLKSIIDRVEQIFDTVIDMLRKRSFDRLDDVLTMRDELFDRIDAVMKNQLRRMRDTGGSTSANMLFFNILGETKTMVLHSRNIMKSLDHFIDCGR